MRTLRLPLLMFSALAAVAPVAVAQPSFTPIGSFSACAGYSEPYGISADGSTVVGGCGNGSALKPFRWTASTGLQLLSSAYGAAYGVSSDGSVIVGSSGGDAFMWTTTGGLQSLGRLGPSDTATGYDITADGSMIVGHSGHGGAGTRHQAFVWTVTDGMVPLPNVPNYPYAYAYATSADGSIIAGTGNNSCCGEAAVWDGTSWTKFGPLGGQSIGSSAVRVSADGNYVVGNVHRGTAGGRSPYIAPSSGGYMLLDAGLYGIARDLTANGSVVVGQRISSSLGDAAFIWDSTNGVRLISDVLTDLGLGAEITGWTLIGARVISDDGSVIGGHGIDSSGYPHAWIATIAGEANDPPTADAGDDQSVRAGDTVNLDGSGSFDDNTASGALEYSWSFASVAAGSAAMLSGANTAMASFTADVSGTFVVELIVTDEGGLASAPDTVEASSTNLAPTANAGENQTVIVNQPVFLDGSDSSDPESDPLTFQWSVAIEPAGSMVSLTDAQTPSPSFTPLFAGSYEFSLVVEDFIGPSSPDSVIVTASTAEDLAEMSILSAADIVSNLTPAQYRNQGNRNAFANFLRQAIVALQDNDVGEAVSKIEAAIERSNGCIENGTPDGNGPGRDWITECGAQSDIHLYLTDAIDKLTM